MERILKVLAKKKISQAELSRLTGLAAPYVNRIVRGAQRPGLDTAQRIAAALEVSVEELWPVQKKGNGNNGTH